MRFISEYRDYARRDSPETCQLVVRLGYAWYYRQNAEYQNSGYLLSNVGSTASELCACEAGTR